MEWDSRNRLASIVSQTTIEGAITFEVSTVFLGLNHRHGEGEPLIFETMIFPQEIDDGELDFYQERCSTWEQAVAQHERACVAVHLWIGRHPVSRTS
jgi:hypothetical protein